MVVLNQVIQAYTYMTEQDQSNFSSNETLILNKYNYYYYCMSLRGTAWTNVD